MKIKLDVSRTAIAGALVAGLPATAFAQVIVYAPAATAVPTLSQWGVLILAVLLAMAAVYMGRKSGNPLLSGLLLVAAAGGCTGAGRAGGAGRQRAGHSLADHGRQYGGNRGSE